MLPIGLRQALRQAGLTKPLNVSISAFPLCRGIPDGNVEKFAGATFPTPQQAGILDKRGHAVSTRANMMELQRRSMIFS